MSFTEAYGDGGFSIDLGSTTEIIGRFHRKLMDRRELDWEGFEPESYEEEMVEQARQEWASRAVAEYYSTAQFGQLLHRLCQMGAPVELIGAATRLATDECRHAELCARLADELGGRAGFEVEAGPLSLHDEIEDRPLAVYRTILQVCCFGETLSVPVLEAMHVVANDPLVEEIAGIIAADEGYHMNFGWEAMEWMTPKLDDSQREAVVEALPGVFASFEQVCAGGPEMLDQLAGSELTVEEDEEPNLAILSRKQYAGIFYHAIEADIIPRLEELGFDARQAWKQRLAVGN